MLSAIELSVKLSNSEIKSPIVCTISTVMHFAAEGRSLIEIFKVIEIIWSQEIEFLLEFSWEESGPGMDKGCNGTIDVVISINSKWTIWLRNMPIYSTTLITSIFSHKQILPCEDYVLTCRCNFLSICYVILTVQPTLKTTKKLDVC